MGRYLVGTKQFSYKYLYAEQDANLCELAGVSGAGAGGLEPLLSASMDDLERTDDVPVMELLRAAVRRTGNVGGETRALLSRRNTIHPRSFELVMYAVAESIVGVAASLDDRLEAPAQRVSLCGRAAYELRRADHARLLAWIDGFLDAPVSMAAIAGNVDPIGERLRGIEGDLPFLGLYILHHAVANDLEVMEVAEARPETTTRDYWRNAREEWGPPALSSREVPHEPDALFARALVAFWEGKRDEAARLLRTSHERGDGRAYRWLRAAGEVTLEPLARVVVGPSEDHAAVLEAVFVLRDLEAEWRRSDRPDLESLDRMLEGKAVAASELRRLVASRSEQLGDVDELSREVRAVQGAALRRVAEEIALTAELVRARDAEDVTATGRLLVRARQLGVIEDLAAGAALSVMLDHGTTTDARLAYDVVRALVPLERRTEHHVAYNLACAAARLGYKSDMLACLRAGRLDGDEPRDALADPDFAAWHDDPDLRALANDS